MVVGVVFTVSVDGIKEAKIEEEEGVGVAANEAVEEGIKTEISTNKSTYDASYSYLCRLIITASAVKNLRKLRALFDNEDPTVINNLKEFLINYTSICFEKLSYNVNALILMFEY
ncbi:hypothetical protein GQX74_014923 [Glossina fuscipes]|nr:hypothetical protein GQX74_014923 [Glossina fuscipes]